MIKTFTYMMILLGSATGVFADLLVLESGESVSGTLSKVKARTLIFRTSLSGQMMVPADTIKALSTDANFVVTLEDGTVKMGRFVAKDNATAIFPLKGDHSESIDFGAVVDALPIPSTGQPQGSSDIGAVYRSGDKDGFSPGLRAGIAGEGAKLDWSAEVSASGGDRLDFFCAETLLKAKQGESMGPYAFAQIERDTNQSLDLRAHLALGLFKVFSIREKDSIEGYLGLDLAREHWNRDVSMEGKTGDSHYDTEFNGHLGLRYFNFLSNHMTLIEALDLFPEVSDLGSFRATSQTSLLVPVGGRLRLRLDFRVGYDNGLWSSGVSKWSTAVGAGVGMNF